LSADNKWMRLIIDGDLIASFHVNYVRKVLGTQSKDESPTERTTVTKLEKSANL
jgi:hypothetical protein